MSKPTDIDLRDGFEAFTEDMAEHQKAQGKLPTAPENQALAALEFEKLENQGAFARSSEPEGPIANQFPPPDSKVTREVNGRTYTVTRDTVAPTGAELAQPAEEKIETMLILRRLLLLLQLQDSGPAGAPSWKKRVVAVLDRCGGTMGAFMRQPGKVARELDELLEASNRYFGDWRRLEPEPKKLFVGL
jgi:hypothetical protein